MRHIYLDESHCIKALGPISGRSGLNAPIELAAYSVKTRIGALTTSYTNAIVSHFLGLAIIIAATVLPWSS